ncbi:MAG: hypothetical protein I8H68_08505 [Flavobacteriia bacterium]|nr:hypothetical protein [Flavobacteriia bacterium]MBH2023778.1 hypothetical protein [Flavobacteriales bacterium]
MPEGKRIGNPCLVYHVQPCSLGFQEYKRTKAELLIGDLKRYTSKSIVKATEENPREGREEFLFEFFRKEGAKSTNLTHYQFWRHDNKPIELWSNRLIQEKITYVHQNPVEGGLVFRAD